VFIPIGGSIAIAGSPLALSITSRVKLPIDIPAATALESFGDALSRNFITFTEDKLAAPVVASPGPTVEGFTTPALKERAWIQPS